MASANSHSPFGGGSGFADAALAEKHQRVARESLQALMSFNEAIDNEMIRLRAHEREGFPVDREMIGKMTCVKEKYEEALSGLRGTDDIRGRQAMVTLADAIQDLMAHIHLRASH